MSLDIVIFWNCDVLKWIKFLAVIFPGGLGSEVYTSRTLGVEGSTRNTPSQHSPPNIITSAVSILSLMDLLSVYMYKHNVHRSAWSQTEL